VKTCILLGDRSDIGKALVPFLEADGYHITGWNRDAAPNHFASQRPWDLVLSAIGQVAPVGAWDDLNDIECHQCIHSNVIEPIKLLRYLWPRRNPGASACFMAGSNPQRIMAGYLPYNIGKMALLKAVEQIDYESPDCKVFALGPGYVPTKIHRATLDANWPNERIARGDAGTPIERIYACLKWCIAQPKEVVGGRNIAASDPWDGAVVMDKSRWGISLEEELKANPSMYKLRRVE
jgi:NAD(P)-dependent dehydrogenase (short-subunit alcohol dehydrogenase family)